MTKIFEEYYIDYELSRHQMQPTNEAWQFVTKAVINILIGVVEHFLGAKVMQLFGEEFKRSDGSYGSGIRLMNSAGDMIRFNTSDKNPRDSILTKTYKNTLDVLVDVVTFGLGRPFCSLDYWKSSNDNLYKPNYTCFIHSHLGDVSMYIRNPELLTSIFRFMFNGKTGEFNIAQGNDTHVEITKGRIEDNKTFKALENFAENNKLTKINKSLEELVNNKTFLDNIWKALDLEGHYNKAIKSTAKYVSENCPSLIKTANSVSDFVNKVNLICTLKEHNPSIKDNEIEMVSARLGF